MHQAAKPAPGHDLTRICVIEDNDDVRSLICRILTDAGFAPSDANNGRSGVRLVLANKPALVITDMLMPEQNGVETIIALKAETPTLPIIAISGGGMIDGADLRDLATQCGASAVLAKPFRPRDLVLMVRELLGANALPPMTA